MKNKLRKYISIERRDFWDGPREYLLGRLSVDKLKHMLQHTKKKDRRIKSELERALEWRMQHK
jgi:hypothetical protein